MEKVEFRCLNCGERVEKNLLPGKHTILGSIPVVNKEQNCCERPEYEDNRGYHRNMMERSIRDYIPAISA